MRHALLISLLSASVSLAQNGVWTGYVGGWQNTPNPVAVYPLALTYQTPAYRQRNFVERNSYGYGYAPGYFPSFPDTSQQEAMAAQAAQYAAQQEQAAQQRHYEREQQLAAEAQVLAQQQQLAAQQQMVAQQQQQALADELARATEREAKARQAELEQQKLLADREAERLRAEADAKPKEKGPDIHRWVDEDGVVHLSTKPRH